VKTVVTQPPTRRNPRRIEVIGVTLAFGGHYTEVAIWKPVAKTLRREWIAFKNVGGAGMLTLAIVWRKREAPIKESLETSLPEGELCFALEDRGTGTIDGPHRGEPDYFDIFSMRKGVGSVRAIFH